MAILNHRELRDRGAAAADSCRSEGRRLVLVYCGVIAALSLGSNGLHLFLDSRIGTTGGLEGLGLRSVLQTVQEILNYVNLFFSPFWSAGFLYAMLAMVRGRAPRTGDLTAGFRRFGRVLGHMAFELLVTLLLMVTAINLADVIFSFSPLGTEFAERMGTVLTDPNLIAADGTVDLSLVPMDAMLSAIIPMAIITLVLFLPVCVYLSYCFRMSLYLVMERRIGAIRAHFESLRLMRGHKWQMAKLDLSFWWYYVLSFLIAVVGYLDVILTLLGVPLPMDATVMFFLTLAVYCVLQTALFLWKKCQVDAAYVLAYEAIAYPEPVQALTRSE